MLVMACIGWLIERVVINPVLGEPAFAIVMLTIGIGYVLRGGITMIPDIGTETHSFEVPYKDLTFNVGGVVLGAPQLVVIGSRVSIVLLSLIWESCSNVTPTGFPWASKSTIKLSLIASEQLLSRSLSAMCSVSVSGK
jgi:branched-subunit amino acid ABC-type transport system permease component